METMITIGEREMERERETEKMLSAIVFSFVDSVLGFVK